MLPKKLIIFIYLLFKAAQPLMASEVFYTNTIDPDSYLNFGRTIRKVDLNDNTFFKLIDNAVLCDVSNDESLILYSPSNSLDEYSYPGDPQSFIIKNLYQYDTLNIHGHNARFTSNGDIISFTTHSFDYYDLYNNDNNAGLSSIQTYSRSGDSVTVLSDSIFYGFYILSDDKNRILWLEKVSAEDSLEIFIHTIDNGQTNTLNAKISTTVFFDANESNLFFWARNDLLYASLMDSNSVYCLFSIDISQNPDSFTKIFSSDTDIVILPTQDFEYDKFLFSQKITDGIWYEKIWVHNINDESSEFVFDFFSGQSLYHYIWSADTSKIYFTSSPTSWGYGGSSGPFYEYDFPSDLVTILSNTYSFSYSSSLIHFDNNVNTGPSNTELIHPLQNENIELNQYNINDSTTFSWSLSQDTDNDSLSYTLCLWDRDEYYDWIYGTQLTNPFKILEQNLADTTITLSNSYLYDIYMEAYNEDIPYFRWSVDVTDGFHILDMNYGNAHRITLNYVHTPPIIESVSVEPLQDYILLTYNDDEEFFYADTGYFKLNIQNSGSGILYIDSIDVQLTQNIQNAFSVSQLPFTIQPFSTDTIEFGLISEQFGMAEVEMFLATNDVNFDSSLIMFEVPIVAKDEVAYSVQSLGYWDYLDLGELTVGETIDTSITIISMGERSLEIDDIYIPFHDTSLIHIEYEEGGLEMLETMDIAISITPNEPGYYYFEWQSSGIWIKIESNADLWSPNGCSIPQVPCEPQVGITFSAVSLSNDESTVLPYNYVLHQNYPNPFNPITSLRYDLPDDGMVNITVYDMMGRIVKTLENASQTTGFKSVQWNATNDRNEPVSAGLYLYTIQAGEFRQTKKMVLLK